MSDVTPIALDLDLGELEAENEADDAQPQGKKMGLVPMAIAAVAAAGVAGGGAFVLTPGAKDINPACAELLAAQEDGHGDDGHSPSTDDHGSDHGAEAAHGEAADEHGEAEEHAVTLEECLAEEVHSEDDKKKKKADKSHGGGHGGGEEAQSDVKPLGAIQHSEHATFLVLEPMVISIQPIGRSKHLRVSLVFETDDEGAQLLLDNGFYVQDVLNTYLRSVDHTVLEDPSSMSRLRAQILRRIRVIVPDASVTNVLITEFILT